MEEEWITNRAELRQLLNDDSKWTNREIAEKVRRSLGWVYKWKKRLKGSSADDEQVVRSQSRRRHQLPPEMDKRIEAAILEIRGQPPEQLHRSPGPRTILYYLQQRTDLKAEGLKLPRSPSTIWKTLKRCQRTGFQFQVKHQPLETEAEMDTWEMDFTDVTTVQADPDGKKQHEVEVLNVIDVGTSILVASQPRADYHAETALEELIAVFATNGLPRRIRLDRDPRFIGSWSAQEYPSAMMRFLLNLGIEIDLCPPHRPDLKPFVERVNRTMQYECLLPEHPNSLGETQDVLKRFYPFYNSERPHQGRSCRNLPPRIAHPNPKTNRQLPARIDPDHWLKAYAHKNMTRHVDRAGTISIDRFNYYIGRAFYGKTVLITVDVAEKKFRAEWSGKIIKQLSKKVYITPPFHLLTMWMMFWLRRDLKNVDCFWPGELGGEWHLRCKTIRAIHDVTVQFTNRCSRVQIVK